MEAADLFETLTGFCASTQYTPFIAIAVQHAVSLQKWVDVPLNRTHEYWTHGRTT